MLDERAEGDPLEGSRVMLAGRAEGGSSGDEAAIFRRRYLNAHPSAEAFVEFKDFSFSGSSRGRPSGRGFRPDRRPEAGTVLDRYLGRRSLLEAERGPWST